MVQPPRKNRGFTLIEMLVVLAIVGILSIVGVLMIGNRPSGSVRAIMDELEGVLAAAHKRAMATGQDVVITTTGEWSVPNVLRLTYTGATGGDNFSLAHSEANGIPVGILREHMHAGVVTVTNAGWWATARGASANIANVAPFNSATSGFQVGGTSILDDNTLNLFQGGAGQVTAARISGANKRFTTTCWIEIVGLSEGNPIPGGPMGVLVVQANGATIYKFYNPGSINGGDGTWRRI